VELFHKDLDRGQWRHAKIKVHKP